MKLNNCKLLKKHQLKLAEFFVLEATARSAANLLGIQPNSAALFYRKLRTASRPHAHNTFLCKGFFIFFISPSILVLLFLAFLKTLACRSNFFGFSCSFPCSSLPGHVLSRTICHLDKIILDFKIIAHTINSMSITFGAAKNAINLSKHGVSLELAHRLEGNGCVPNPIRAGTMAKPA